MERKNTSLLRAGKSLRESVQSLKQMCQHLEPCEEIFSRIKKKDKPVEPEN